MKKALLSLCFVTIFLAVYIEPSLASSKLIAHNPTNFFAAQIQHPSSQYRLLVRRISGSLRTVQVPLSVNIWNQWQYNRRTRLQLSRQVPPIQTFADAPTEEDVIEQKEILDGDQALRAAFVLDAKQQPKWLEKMQRFRIYPYAWAVWDVRRKQSIKRKYLNLSSARASRLASVAVSISMYQRLQMILDSRIRYKRRYNNFWYCFLAQDVREKQRFMAVCFDKKTRWLHVAVLYNSFNISILTLGFRSTYTMTKFPYFV